MASIQRNMHTAHVPEPDSDDRDVIRDLHVLGLAFQKAVGAYIVDNPTKFPAGTLSKIIDAKEQTFILGIANSLSSLNDNTSMTMEEIVDHATYYGVHLHCMFMKTEERYLKSLNVSFKAVADSVDVDVSDKEAMAKKLAVCDKYGFAPMTQFLNLKLAA